MSKLRREGAAVTAGAIFHFAVAGHRLRAKRIGEWDASRVVLVLLHEGLGSIPQWRDFPEALSGACGLPVLLYERSGHGGSDPVRLPRPSNYLEIEAEQVLPGVLAACGIERPILIGHSDGGTIALLYAAAFPEKPVACITEAAHVLVEEATLSGIRAASMVWARDGDFRRRLARHHGHGVEALFRGWAETWTRPDRRDWNMLDRLGAVRCPVLAIQGADDAYGTRAQLDEIVARVSGPAESVLIPDCAHVPHQEAPATVLACVRSFIGKSLARLKAQPAKGP
jgi:pimeloyl-ACP methyl ester carboxylesterase